MYHTCIIHGPYVQCGAICPMWAHMWGTPYVGEVYHILGLQDIRHGAHTHTTAGRRPPAAHSAIRPSPRVHQTVYDPSVVVPLGRALGEEAQRESLGIPMRLPATLLQCRESTHRLLSYAGNVSEAGLETKTVRRRLPGGRRAGATPSC